MEKTQNRVNIAPSSKSGHYVEKAKQVIDLDMINEIFMVKGGGIMTTKNHTTLNMESDCLVTCQQVYNPFTKMMERSRD